MKIAVVGSGIAGNIAAWKLSREHEVTVFEADSRPGGHTHTVDVELAGERYAVDTGFIVFNDWTYPNFIAMLDELDVPWQDSDMSFSVKRGEPLIIMGQSGSGKTSLLRVIGGLWPFQQGTLSKPNKSVMYFS